VGIDRHGYPRFLLHHHELRVVVVVAVLRTIPRDDWLAAS
jgi:hypothetical protein